MKKAVCLMFSAVLLAAPLQGQTVQTVLSYPGSQPVGVAVDLRNNVYYTLGLGADPVGAYSQGTFASVLTTDASPLVSPSGIAIGRGGLLITDMGKTNLQFLDPVSAQVTAPWTAQFSNPSGVAVDAAGAIYVVDWNGLQMITPSNEVVTLSTDLNRASSVALGDAGQLWVADTRNNVIKLLQLSGTNVTNVVVIGKLRTPGYQDSPTATNALFNQPRGLVWTGGQTGLFVADTGNNAIRTVSYNSSGKTYSVGTLATGFNAPIGLAMDNEGTLLVADSKSGSLRSITRPGQPAPILLPPAGAYSNAITATFSTTLATKFSPALRYTLDGTQPTLLSPMGNSATFNGGATLVQVRCFSPDLATSIAVSNLYTFFAATPACSPAGAVSDNCVTVSLDCATAGARLYWTLNGSEPSPTNGALYSGPFIVATNGVLKYMAARDGYTNSAVSSNSFNLAAADPIISPAGASTNDGVSVVMSSSTTNALIYWTVDGSDPTTNATLYNGPFFLQAAGTIKAKAFLPGFIPSQTVSATFNLTVADPLISPNGAASDNSVQVSFATATPGASLYWTVDGSEPAPDNGTLYTGPFMLGTNGTLTVKGFRNGFVSSAKVSAVFNLFVAAPVATPESIQTINAVTVSLSSTTAGATLRYTLDGSSPTLQSPVWSGPLTLVTNSVLTAVGYRGGFVSSAPVVNTYQIQVDTPVMTPPGGYFPNGSTVSLSVQRSNPGTAIYYTVNGQDPTTNDTLYGGPFSVDQVALPGSDLRVIKARAFSPNTVPSAVIAGETSATNVVGVPRNFVAGIGSTIVLPVVVNMSTTQQLRSLQFRIEIVPSSPGAPALTNFIEALDISTNDFVPVVVGSSDLNPTSSQWEPYRRGVTNGGSYASIATNLLIEKFGVVANLKVKIPNSAIVGDAYTVTILGVSGTSDGAQHSVPMAALPSRTLTISNVAYLAGDCSPGSWYNAGEFGKGSLDNADVNAVFEASVGIHKPFSFSDAYNAMDVYPETPSTIGDGLITFLDWQHVLRRSLGLETNNWVRWWGPNGTINHSNTFLPTFSAGLRASLNRTETNNCWLRHAVVGAGTLTNVMPGQVCSMPVYVRVLSGFSLAGLQFRAVLTPEGDAPAAGTIQFAAAGGLPSPLLRLLPASNEIACAWSLGLFDKPLSSSNLLGYLNFQVPRDAQAGQRYTLRLLFPGGAADYDTELALESACGSAWVMSAPNTVQRVVSDQWKTNFFAGLPSGAAENEADPDLDGVPNWQEYLAGTDPTNAASRMQFSAVGLQPDPVAPSTTLQWETVPGRVYAVESSSSLFGGTWTPVVENIQGNGGVFFFTQTNLTGHSRFFRLRLQQP